MASHPKSKKIKEFQNKAKPWTLERKLGKVTSPGPIFGYGSAKSLAPPPPPPPVLDRLDGKTVLSCLLDPPLRSGENLGVLHASDCRYLTLNNFKLTVPDER